MFIAAALLLGATLIALIPLLPKGASRIRGESGPEVATAFREKIAAGPITFMTYEGQYFGTDADIDVTFHGDGRAVMTEHGDTLETYEGTYTIADDGTMTASFQGYLPGWPVMLIMRDERSLILQPRDMAQSRFTEGDGVERWTFRPIDASAPPGRDQ